MPAHAFKGYASSCNVGILNSFSRELQLEVTESAIKNNLMDLLTELKNFKFVTTLALEFKKIKSDDKTQTQTLNSKTETIINEIDIDDAFKSVYGTIIPNKQKYLGKGSGWIIDSVIDHNINISNYNPSPGSSYNQITKRIRPSKKRFD